MENHGLFAGRSDQVADVIRRVNSSALRSTFDTGNFLLVGQSPNEAIDQLKDNVKHVHVKDFLKVEETGKGVLRALNGDYYLGKTAGEGEVDLRYIFNELNQNGYSGWLTVEFEGIEEPSAGSIQAVDYVDGIVAVL